VLCGYGKKQQKMDRGAFNRGLKLKDDFLESMKSSQPAIARLESGTYKNPSLDLLNRVALACGKYPSSKFRDIPTFKMGSKKTRAAA
jgi:hypothetical protein